MSIPDIYGYVDFRAWLSAWQKARQAQDPTFTKTRVSHLLGLPRTRGYFTDVVSGKKVSDTFLERFCEILDLSRNEERYFRCLVRFEQADTPEEKELALEQLRSLGRADGLELPVSSWSYYRHWRHGAIRALLATRNLTTGTLPQAAARMHASITPGQALESLQLLRELGLVVQAEDGHWEPAEATIASPAWARDEIFRLLQAQQLDLARTALTRHGDGRRAIATNMVSVSDDALERLRASIDRFRNEVRSIVRHDDLPARHVVLLANVLLPLEEGSR